MPSVSTQLRRPKTRTVLAVRLLVARTAWLDGRHFWRDGRVAWATPGGEEFVPDATAISRTQRHLNTIAGFPRAAALAAGNAEEWMARKRSRLALAKLLRELPQTDLPETVRQAKQRNPAAAPDLSRLLLAEALCLNALPELPSAGLVALGPAALPALAALLRDSQTPSAAGVLAALTLGAISRDLDGREAKLLPALSGPEQDRAFAFGRQGGLPAHPSLVASLLTAGSDDGVIRRGLDCAGQGGGLTVQLLRELLADGLTPAAVVELAEAVQDAETVTEQLRSIRALLPDLQISERQKQWDRQRQAETLRAERNLTVGALEEMVTAYAESTRDPRTVRLVAGFLRRMLELTASLAPNPAAAASVLEHASLIMRLGLKLPPERQPDFWALLTDFYSSVWDPAALVPDPKPLKTLSNTRSWLHDAQTKHVAPLCKMLAAGADKDAVAAIFALGVQRTLADQEWPDPALYTVFVTLAKDLALSSDDYFIWSACRLLNAFPTAREARLFLQGLFQPLRASVPAERRHVLEALLDETGLGRQAVRSLSHVFPLLPALARFADAENLADPAEDECACGPVFAAALALAEQIPSQAQERLETLVSALPPEQKKRDYTETRSLRVGLTLAVTLTAGDADQFRDAVLSAAKHQFRQDATRVNDGLSLVKRFPTLRSPLAFLFGRQPQRVTDLLVRLGLTTRLSTDIQPVLGALDGSVFPVLLHPDRSWWTVHRLAPELTETANAYRYARRLLGQTQDVPPGVRRVLDRPQKLATEQAHLETLLAQNPSKAGIPARIAKLNALLADAERLTQEIRAEVSERLPQAAAEAQFAAAEQQTLLCYRTRLDAVAGPLPPDLTLSEDLLNATLLTVDIAQNRKLLLQLLRAHLAGDRDWREKHPANQAFLTKLTAQNADAETWLSERPRRFPCAGIPGGRVHLRLEKDPLAILQMGNHFETCLSFGGINAFSTVANASELNKRVIYARDSGGHVVGRKLIGMTDTGEMVGFHTYCSLTDETGNTALRGVFRRYAALFAAACRLPLADTGTVPTLFADAWYDDEAVAWADDDASGGERHFSHQVRISEKSLPE